MDGAENSLLALLNAGPQASLLLDTHGRILALNDKMASLLGQPSEKCTDKNFFELSDPALQDLRWAKMQEALSTQKSVRFEQFIGKTLYATTFEPLTTRKNRASQVAVFMEDITRRGDTRKELLEIQRDLALILSSSNQMDEALGQILEVLFRQDEMDAGAVFLKHGKQFRFCRSYGLPEHFTEAIQVLEMDSPVLQPALRGEYVYDLFEKTAFSQYPAYAEQPDLKALAILPVNFQGQIVAILGVCSRTVEQFSPGTCFIMETVAPQLGPIITRAQASEALKESQKNLSGFFQTMDDFIFILTPEGDIIRTNYAVTRKLGYPADQLAENNVIELLELAHRSRISELLVPTPEGKANPPFCLIGQNGEEVHVEMKVTEGSWGGKKALFVIGRNISQRLQAETALVMRERVLEAVGFASEQFLEEIDWEVSAKTVLQQLGLSLEVSRVYLIENYVAEDGELWMRPRMEWTAQGFQPATGPGQRLSQQSYETAGLNRWKEVLAQGNIISDQLDALPPEERLLLTAEGIKALAMVPVFAGPIFWGFIGYEDMSTPRFWSSAELDALYTASNILGAAIQRKQAEQAMRQNLQFHETFVDTIPSPAFYKDASGVYLGCNAAFSQLIMGIPKREIIGRKATDFENLPPDLVDLLFDKDMALVRGPGSQVYEATVPCADGVTRDYLFNKTTFLDDAGRVLGICGVMSDFTDRKKAEFELNQARQQEINIGFEIQNRLLLGTPPQDLAQVEIATLSIPSQQIDGDFYDFIKYDDQHFDLIIGDVMGKGVSAAMLGAAIKTQFLRAIGNLVCSTNLATLPTPEEVLSFVHRMMSQKLMSLNSFATGCYARFSSDKGRMDLVDFGHTRTLHYSTATNECRLIKSENFPLGFSDSEEYVQISEHLDPGDLILFYSDGLVEAVSPDGEQYGLDRLVEFINAHYELDAESLSKELYSELIHYSSSVSFADDLTYIIIKIQEAEDIPLISRDKLEITSELTELARLRDFLQLACRRLPNNTVRFTAQLELATSEAASNIMRHAYKSRGDRPIEAVVDVYRDRVQVRLIHWGEPMQSFQLGTPAFDGSQKHGLGLYFIRNCVDEVKYHTDNQGVSSVSLMKKLKSD